MFTMEGDGWRLLVKDRVRPPAVSALPLALSVCCGVPQVRDEQHQCSLGNLKIPLSRLLASDDMTINQRFQLSNSGPNSTLKMKIAPRVRSLPPEAQGGPGRAAAVRLPGTAPQGSGQDGWWSGCCRRARLAGKRRPTEQCFWVACAACGIHYAFP